MINCIVIDDEQHAVDVLVRYISQTPALRLAGSTNNPLQGLQLLQQHEVDLIFLDIHMPQLSGMDFIKSVSKKYMFILCTAYPNYAAEGFELDVLDYLVKPVSFSRFLKAVQKATTHFNFPQADVNNDFIVVKTGAKGGLHKINTNEILLVEGMKNYTCIHHGGEKTMALISMKEMEEKLPQEQYIRVHKSYIISWAAVKAVEGNFIRLKNSQTAVPLGDSHKAVFLNLMKNKLVGRR